jgi:hypothetical protein
MQKADPAPTPRVCLNGHIRHEDEEEYCPQCGERIIATCPSCGVRITGKYVFFSESKATLMLPHSHCRKCGEVFPWTVRATQAAVELASQAVNLTPEQVDDFFRNVKDAIRQGPRSVLGSVGMKEVIEKMDESASTAVAQTLGNYLNNSSKRLIWGEGTKDQ